MKHLTKLKTLALAAIVLCAASFSPLTAMAAPVEVAHTVTGSSGDYTLDFSVTNNLTPAPPDMSMYLFGVQLSAHDIVGTPTGFSSVPNTIWSNAGDGGSTTNFNNLWSVSAVNTLLLPGSTLSGFQVHETALTVPTNVAWFGYFLSPSNLPYTGGDNFNTLNYNPGFEGFAHVAPVPIPAAAVLFGSGLAGIVAWQRKRLSKMV